MNTSLSVHDLLALSPLLIVLGGALLTLLLDAFVTPEVIKKNSFFLALGTLIVALCATFFAPVTHNPLLSPWLVSDSVGHFFTVFFLITGIALLLLSSAFFARFDAPQGEYYFLFLSSLFGLMLMGIAGDFLILFIGLETSSVSLYVLCGYMKKWSGSEEAAIKYFLMGALGTAFLVYGTALIYGAVGSTQFKVLLPAYSHLSHTSSALFLGGVAFVTVGLFFKAAVVPFHSWAPDVYCGTSTPVAAFMAVASKGGAFAALVRIFTIELVQFNELWSGAVAFLAVPTLLYANIVALRQTQLRRFFAYSSISHTGFLLLPLIAGTPEALSAFSFYLVVYSTATLGAFGIIALSDWQSQGVVMNDLKGFFKRSPLQASALAFFLLTLAGIPPTAGFLAKLYVFKVAFHAGYGFLVLIGLLTSVLAAFYYLRIVSIMFSEGDEGKESHFPMLSLNIITLGSCILLALLSLWPDVITLPQ